MKFKESTEYEKENLQETDWDFFLLFIILFLTCISWFSVFTLSLLYMIFCWGFQFCFLLGFAFSWDLKLSVVTIFMIYISHSTYAHIFSFSHTHIFVRRQSLCSHFLHPKSGDGERLIRLRHDFFRFQLPARVLNFAICTTRFLNHGWHHLYC